MKSNKLRSGLITAEITERNARLFRDAAAIRFEGRTRLRRSRCEQLHIHLGSREGHDHRITRDGIRYVVERVSLPLC